MNSSGIMINPDGWMDSGLVICTVLDIVIGVLLVLVFSKWSRK
jgi:hypothetical protein